MCASYIIRQQSERAMRLLNYVRISEDEIYEKLIVPHTLAPVYVGGGAGAELVPMRFSLLPRWSKEPKVKFATHNARLDSILEKPTWKGVFISRHCLVPMTDFIEPIYSGDFAGNMVSFHQPDYDLLLAAGVWDEWVNRDTGEIVQSFAIITHDPPPFVANTGHDRCPLFLNEENGEEWLQNTDTPGPELRAFLLAADEQLNWKAESFRPMRPGWEKRIPKSTS